MKLLSQRLALAGLLLLSVGAASAGVNVTFVHPETYADMPMRAEDREFVLKDLARHFEKLAANLPAGQELKIEVLDFDMAGRLQPKFDAEGLRVTEGGTDWPHMHLRYALSVGGQVLRSGDEHLKDMAYRARADGAAGQSAAPRQSGYPLRYEKQMIDDWFKKTIAGKQPG
jgi:hypothetical protein